MDIQTKLLWGFVAVLLLVLLLAGRERRGALKGLLLTAPDPNVGERKFGLTLYVMHRVWVTAIVEFCVYLLIRLLFPTVVTGQEILDILREVNYVFLIGTGGAVAIYTGGNVYEWKYRGGVAGSTPPPLPTQPPRGQRAPQGGAPETEEVPGSFSK